MELNEIMSIEEKIEMGYIALARLEISGLNTGFEYEETIKTIRNLINEEKRLLASLSTEDTFKLRKQVLKFCDKLEFSICLGHMTNASYYRLLKILNIMLGSEHFDYAAYLRYDLNQIIFSFLTYLINNETYEEIRNDLIFYKYNLIFMNHLSEEDFLETRNIETISIESKSRKTDYNPDLIFVDKSMLVLEGREHADTIGEYGESFKDNDNQFSLVVISIIELIARLVLSEGEVLHYLQQDFDFLLKDESVSLEVKNIIQEMISVLEMLKSNINIAR